MTPETVISIAERGIITVLMICGPLLILALVVGLVVSIFQATTQIQEQTLAFIPKIVAVLVGVVFFGPWMLSHMLSYANEIFSNLTRFVG
ncbi:flagellar biosynthesis protein FliQ [Cytobacillus firmus]|jgi:flagellar biosynthetic protein FliQ|uniref:Flagellar biosynthetic protein FliQ n=5 Tax=Cytobacillus TaxID=2675230 RepID=A0A1S1YMC0_9BACI|nr:MULTISPECIES: flagellar biosynthesis protein FliQ [Bacillales]EFV79394.1 flagellar biosynthesis protein Q [Bacillus sp. 2_A_57_CT2]AND39405.1 EscS/YscS/HrcS family type III secretion system export apparatus protein [Cytobacillus oceanisediminis 2691]EWG11970.1 flagellar biosynthesis protein FliQ [Cytobacillus firmus DS1]KAF0825841.1 Flagellar biosynthesis protein FliQ [Cytobacillus firmus]KML43749.1 flagellar biosynthesis protein FliQ [Cytobacillus firmus]